MPFKQDYHPFTGRLIKRRSIAKRISDALPDVTYNPTKKKIPFSTKSPGVAKAIAKLRDKL